MTQRCYGLLDFDGEAGVPFVNISTDRACFDGRVGRYGSVLEDSDRPDLGQFKSAIFQDGAVSVLGVDEGVVPVSALEPRIACLSPTHVSLEEAFEGAFQPQGNVLQHLRVHLRQVWVIVPSLRETSLLLVV